MQQNIIITGAGGGFGKLTTLALAQAGHNVVGTLRDIEGRNRVVAAELRGAGVALVDMDVTSDASVEAGMAAALDKLGGRLDVVINNAGYGVMGLQESFTPEDWQKLFDINVFGMVRVNRAALPTLRAQRRGLLVHVSSLLGRMVLPFYGPYNASKWAVEAMAESYRVELGGFGVESVIVEPGGYLTGFIDNLIKPTDQGRDAGYGPMAQAPQHALESFETALKSNPEQDPRKVAQAIVDLIATPAGQRPVRTAVDFTGMASQVTPYNDQLEQIMQNVYGAFGIGGMLKPSVG
ncbi:SDR family oxidoreductase [Pseudoduganella sp. GCM10020061]|uniref:SDR family oxidoreductase n=1 Tax=Pseudoduganella sp. GCM10020061 TaxID=3317345 RepID=UPI003638FD57